MTCSMPEYQYAFDRIDLFENEKHNWDGEGGLPASPSVAAEVRKFLALVRKQNVEVPGLAMGGDGSVAVIWKGEEFYVSADFDGAADYSFFISEGDTLVDSGVSGTLDTDCRLIKYLVKKCLNQTK